MHSAVVLLMICIFMDCVFIHGLHTTEPFQKFWFQPRMAVNWMNSKLSSNSSIIPASDMRDKNRTIWLITTASLPWMTGTSINPLLRAAYLSNGRPEGKIHLLVPWLEKEDQEKAYPPGVQFSSPQQQLQYIKNWIIQEAHMPEAAQNVNITFYAGSYHDEFHSIFPMGDIANLIPDEEADICILEEPEHLSWFKAPSSKPWTDKFRHVVGIIHTNYIMYTNTYKLGYLKSPFLYMINQGICRAYCHKIIKLSGALQEFAPEKEIISNVHGVRAKYLTIGDHCAKKGFTKGAYFVGKLAWPKGLDELFRLLSYSKKRTGKSIPMDAYGQGPHQQEIKDTAQAMKLPITFHGAKDHALLSDYRVFINPSLSEVLCTTVAEALAMGKWVVCAKHPSNQFFEQFPNCLTFRNEEEFAANVYWAMTHDPFPLTPEQRHSLTWEAATERLIEAAKMTPEDMNSNSLTDKIVVWLLDSVGSGKYGDQMRSLLGGGDAALQNEYVERYGGNSILLDNESI